MVLKSSAAAGLRFSACLYCTCEGRVLVERFKISESMRKLAVTSRVVLPNVTIYYGDNIAIVHVCGVVYHLVRLAVFPKSCYRCLAPSSPRVQGSFLHSRGPRV